MACSRAVLLCNNQTITASGSQAGQLIDLGRGAVVIGFVSTGVASGTTPSLTANFQFSPDNSSWKTVFSATAITTSSANEFKRDTSNSLGYFSYWRANFTVSGTTPQFLNVNVWLYIED